MTKKRFYKGEYTNCRYDICEIERDGEIFCTVATKDVDMILEIFNEYEELKCSFGKKPNHWYLKYKKALEKNEELESDIKLYIDDSEKYRELSIKFDNQNKELITENALLEKESEQLKKDIDYWKQVASQYSNELDVFEHCKKYKTECKDIHWSSD